MNNFTLTSNLPTQIEGHKINPHFANVLKILDVWDTAEDEKEMFLSALQSFFLEPLDFTLAVELFCRFLSNEKTETEEVSGSAVNPQTQGGAKGKSFCFNFDAKEIYTDFIREYSIDLLSVEYSHWYKFSILLKCLSDKSSFKQKISLRFMDLSQYKGKARAEMEKAKQAVQLPVKLNREEMGYVQEMRGKLRQGKN